MDKLGFEIQKEIVKIALTDTQYCVLCFSTSLLTIIILGYFFINVEDIRLENQAKEFQGKNGVDIISPEEFEYNKKQCSEKHLNRLFANPNWNAHVSVRKNIMEEDFEPSEQDLFDEDGETMDISKLEDEFDKIDSQYQIDDKD